MARYTETEIRAIRRMAGEGATIADIAASLGRGLNSVWTVMRRLGISAAHANGRRYSERDKKLVRVMLAAGASLDQIARALNATPDSIKMLARRHGLYPETMKRRRILTDADWSRIERAIHEGGTLRDIADRAGASMTTVARRIRHMGLRLQSTKGYYEAHPGRIRHARYAITQPDTGTAPEGNPPPPRTTGDGEKNVG